MMRPLPLRALAAKLEPWCVEPGDTEDERSRKAVFALTFALILPAAILWGSMYLALGAVQAAAMPYSYFFLASLSFVVLQQTRDFRLFQLTQCTLILGVSFCLQLALGGFVSGSAVVAWCFLAPLLAVLVVGLREALVWFGLFLGAITVAAIVQHDLVSSNTLPAWAVNAFFVLNLGGPAIFAFTMLFSFVKAKAELRVLERSYLEQSVMLRQREKLATLGTLAAGVAHELNNPAAAVARNADQMGTALDQLRDSCMTLSSMTLTPEQVLVLEELCSADSAKSATASAAQTSDLDAELEDWLESRGVERSWELAPILVEHGHAASSLALALDGFSPTQQPAVCVTLARSLAARSIVAGIGDGATRISDIVAALRSYSYLDRGTRQSVDVTEGLESTLVLLRAKLAGMRIERDYQPDLASVWVHGSALNQVWTNIIDNAIDATGGSGCIILRTRHGDNADGGDCLVVEIEDDGPGMPPDVIAQVFDPFFTTKEPGKGTGLGLNISHNIVVAEHKGTIAVDSRPGRTCFRVELPLAPIGDGTS